ncbi:MAG: cobyrinate a,c-diamide synthase [Gallionellaceae bacterium]
MNRLLISAAHKSSGKTTVSIGLCAALRMRGHSVQPYKKGPDYIDPMWLSQACGRACRNLDLYLMERDDVVSTFARHSSAINLVEGNKGLYDGLALDGSNSNAELAKLLDLPVVLVIDARGMTRGIAPLILGYQAFDRDIHITGVILNNLGGSRHEAKLRAVIEHYTDVPVIGAIQHDERLEIVERHLGLMPSNESGEAANRIRQIGEAIAEQVDLDKLLAITAKAEASITSFLPPCPREEEGVVVKPLKRQQPRTMVKDRMGAENITLHETSTPSPTLPLRGEGGDRVRIGIARDRAFGFYYADDLDALTAAGAELVPFDTLNDAHLPDIDALYIGGGFPEMCARELEANTTLRAEIKHAIESGMPAYAECGGLMYLTRQISHQGRTYKMVGAIPADTLMHDKPVGRGYVHLSEEAAHLWPRPTPFSEKSPPIQIPLATLSPYASGRKGERKNQPLILAHEFHYSSLANLPADCRFAYRVTRGHGIDGKHDGLMIHNLLASYTHLRSIGSCYWASRFVAFVQGIKQEMQRLRLQAVR